MANRGSRARWFLVPFMLAALATPAGRASGAEDPEGTEAKKFDAGDLGLDDLEQPKGPPADEPGPIGIGVNATLAPPLVANGVALQPSLSLRMWFGSLMLEPLFGLGVVAGDAVDPAQLQLSAGLLVGVALGEGNLRPILGGGLTLGIVSGDSTNVGLTLGPLFGLEYRFQELPALTLDAALFLPIRIEVDPFLFSLATNGGALVGFHYYF